MPKERQQLLVTSEDMMDRDMLGYIMRAPYHYRVAQFYEPSTSPFRRRHKQAVGTAAAGGAGGYLLKVPSAAVGQDVARTASQAGLHPSHAQRAHKITQVGTPGEGRAMAEAASAAANDKKPAPPSTPYTTRTYYPQRSAVELGMDEYSLLICRLLQN
jgi:hypothetical protein